MFRMRKIIFVTVCILFRVKASCNYDSTEKSITCSNTDLNEIQTFVPEFQNDIQTIIVNDSTITSLPNDYAFPFVNLKEIKMQSDLREIKSRSLSNLQKLETLDLHDNQISRISLNSLENLITLNLSQNNIDSVRAETFDQPALKFLDLSGNSIQIITTGLLNKSLSINEFNISSNDLDDIQAGAFDSLKDLMKLDLSLNNLRSIRSGLFNALSNLKELSIRGNELTNISAGVLDSLKNLKKLDLSNNGLEHLNLGAFNENKNLTDLNLSYTEIEDLPLGIFDNLQKLKVLNLSHNYLQRLRPNTFTSAALEIIDLSFNNLKTLEPNVLSSENLKEVYLNNNLLSILETNTFAASKYAIERIDIRHNRLVYIKLEFFKPLHNVKNLEIGGNPWLCECLNELIKFMNKRGITYTRQPYFDGTKPTCIVGSSDVCDYQIIESNSYENILQQYTDFL